MTLSDQMTELGRAAKAASRALACLSTDQKNSCLLAMADALEKNHEAIQNANAKDLNTAKEMGLSTAMIDRLTLTDERITAMATGLREVAELADPVGTILNERTRPNGLKLQKVSTPIGVIVIIYESRPNVTADAASLCFKSGNATILRGGKEAIHSNQIIARLMVEAAKKHLPQFPDAAIQVVPLTDREAIPILLSLTDHVDLCIPRGGEGLIRAVADCSKVPVIKHYKGVCHVYADAAADLAMASDITVNSKIQRPGVCNALETLLVSGSIAQEFLPKVAIQLAKHEVEIRGDEATVSILQSNPECQNANLKIIAATDADWDAEYLDYTLAIRVVDGLDTAIAHINQYGSAHTDSIVTSDESAANRFMNEVDSSAVFWNTSTRFSDGGQFGMGAEIGISTDKVGARGPMGLEELTTYKWLGFGTGQTRD